MTKRADELSSAAPTAASGAGKKSRGPTQTTREVALTPAEMEVLQHIKQACADAGLAVSRNDVLRGAISLLAAQTPEAVMQQWLALQPVKRKKSRK